jgi:hypothetical protein
VGLRPAVVAALRQHGLAAQPEEAATDAHARLQELYLREVRALRARQRAGDIALRDYAAAVAMLRARFPLLSLPLAAWQEAGPDARA